MGPFPLVAAGHRPLASLAQTGLEKLFHNWIGASGRRYVCSVYPIGEQPVFDANRAVAAAVRRDANDASILFVFQPARGETRHDFARWTDRARACGADEWHVHLLAETAVERAFIVGDLFPSYRHSA
ncbi:hypothetical protein [Rhodoblastus sp.]|uniref:hypothetical protein n=1 Tax=Rhodoblastus sp. TaxID=1962975 RepID=UPI002622D2EC|nr:hypothetical protein [Rhodoblastus sp.]